MANKKFVPCKNCPCLSKDECDDAHAFGYCPLLSFEEDYSSAVYRELKEQNGDF